MQKNECRERGFHKRSGRREVRQVRSYQGSTVKMECERCADCGTWADPNPIYWLADKRLIENRITSVKRMLGQSISLSMRRRLVAELAELEAKDAPAH